VRVRKNEKSLLELLRQKGRKAQNKRLLYTRQMYQYFCIVGSKTKDEVFYFFLGQTRMKPVILLFDGSTTDSYTGDRAYIPRCFLFDKGTPEAKFCLANMRSLGTIEKRIIEEEDWPSDGTDLVSFIRRGDFKLSQIINLNSRGPNERWRSLYSSVPVDIVYLDPDDGYHMSARHLAVPTKEWTTVFGDVWTKEKHELLWSKYLGGYPFDHKDEEKDTFLWDKYQFPDENLLVQTVQPSQIRHVKFIRYEFRPEPEKDCDSESE
jgi:hypothetical protein